MAISAQDVNKLRNMTGAGMMDCKKALTEAEGDFEKAVDILRKKGQKISASRSDRQTTEGIVLIETSKDGSTATVVALGCETDFVALNKDFIELGGLLLAKAVKKGLNSTDELLVETEGKLTIAEHLTDQMGKIGEKLSVEACATIKAEKVATYLHANKKIGVVVAFEGVGKSDITEIGRDIAMQIAAMAPVSVDETSVPQEVIDRELAIGREQAIAEGKPEAMVDKIAQGKLQKFYKESTLLSQAFIKDNSKSVKQALADVSKTLKVVSFKRVQIG